MNATDHDRPETYSAYHTVVKVRLSEDRAATVVGLKATGLDIYFADGEVLHFDLEGRLQRVARPLTQWRRGLSGRVLWLCRKTEGGGIKLERRHLAPHEAEALIAAANERVRPVLEKIDTGDLVTKAHRHGVEADQSRLRQVVMKAAAFDCAAAKKDVSDFREIYHDIPILPPDQYGSLVLLASEGCRYNKCTFCDFYRDVSYRARPVSLFREHVEQAVRYHGAALAGRRHIFLGQANALMGPRAWREDVLQLINGRFEMLPSDAALHQPAWWKGFPDRFTGVTSFLDAFVGARIGAGEFATMRRLNLRQITIGMESGASELLRWLRKPADPEAMLATVRAAKQGGVAVSVIILVGAGGERFFDVHVRESIELIRQMRLTTGDCVYLSPLVSTSGAEYDQLAAADGIVPLSAARMADQEKRLRAGIAIGPKQQRPYIAHYEVEHFIY